MSTSIFPYPLARISGLSINKLNNCIDNNLLVELDFCLKEILKLEDKKEELNKELFELVSKEKDEKVRNKLLNIKRDLFNNRDIQSNILFADLNKSLNGKLEQYYVEQVISKRNIEKSKLHYEEVLQKERVNLKALFYEFPLANAMLLSSQVLLEGILKYSPDSKENKKKLQIEASMYKYASRICCKTSPFSTLTSVGVTKLSKANTGEICAQTIKRLSNIKFNSLILRQFIICLKASNYRGAFSVILNPSIEKKQRHYRFLINKYNKETFQTLECNEVIDLIYLKLKNKSAYTYSRIIEILANRVDGSINEIERYVLDLIDFGFIEIHTGVSEIDLIWEEKFLKFLKKAKVSEVIISKFNLLINEKERYLANIHLETRQSILFHIYELYKKIIDELLLSSNYTIKKKEQLYYFYRQTSTFNFVLDYTFKEIDIENLLYEDARRDIKLGVSHIQVEQFSKIYKTLREEIKLFKLQNTESFKMLNFYKESYKENVTLLTFYEDYFRSKHELQLKGDEPSLFSERFSEKRKKINFQKAQWKMNFKNRVIEAEKNSVFYFDHIFVSSLVEKDKVEHSNENIKGSYGSFMQFYFDENEGKTMAVCSSVFPGFGKLYSRFLDLLPTQILTELKKSNNTLLEDNEIFAENTDATVFNANLHPSIMDYEINIPGGNNSLGKEKQIPVSDIVVRYNERNDRLELVHKNTGKSIRIFDLAFQGSSNRSNLFQLLDSFSFWENIGNSYLGGFNDALVRYIYIDNDIEKKIRFYPRIIYNKTIIVQRKLWMVTPNCLPEFNKENFDHFIVCNKWRNKLGLPSEVFVRVGRRSDVFQMKKDKLQRQDNYKPQYINFNSPLSVNYFVRMARRITQDFTIEEMLPNSEQLIKIDDEKAVTEFLVQWNDANK